MANEELYLRFLVALAIGLAVGVERGWTLRGEKSGEREAGIRTFTIFALTGFAAGIGFETFGPIFLSAAALCVFALIAIGYTSEVLRDDGDRGATTEIAGFLTFILGALCGVGLLLAAGLVAVVLVILLDQKPVLHDFVARIERMELTAAAKIALISVAILPVLPNTGFGPGQVLNPYELWWAVVVIATLGFVGYAAMKIGGAERGAIFMGLVGGLMSSTGVTVSASRASKTSKGAALPLAGAIATAQAVMFVRTAVFVSVLNAALLHYVAVPIALGALTAATGALIVVWRATEKKSSEGLDPGSPDTIMAAIKFVAVVAAALLVSYYAQQWLGEAGMIASGLIAGAVDVDAATVSAARLTEINTAETALRAGAASIAAALVANSIVKSVIAFTTGARETAWPAIIVLGSSALAVLIGLGVSLFVWPG
jgi:uncharacterized membrane protein (DUF4010 family)